MAMYEQAYQRYLEKCRQFGIANIDLIQFIKSVSEAQVHMMIRKYN